MRQKAICLTLVLCLTLLSPCSTLAFEEDPTQTDFDHATAAELGKTCSGTFNEDGSTYYKFKLKKSGKIKLTLSLTPEYLQLYGNDTSFEFDLEIYEGTKSRKMAAIYTMESLRKGITGTLNKNIRLISGTYYLRIAPFYSYTKPGVVAEPIECSCKYSFKLKYTADRESFRESVNKRNNSIKNANHIKLNKQYRGQFAENDQADCYKFKLSKARRLHITFISSDSRMREITMSIKKPSGRTVKKTSVVQYNWLPDYWEVSLKAGTYCLRVYNDWVDTGDEEYESYFTGTYKFKVCAYGAYPKATTYLEFGWPKRSWGNGYLAKVASDKKFTKNVRTEVVEGRSETSVCFDDLPKGKTYYVKVRPYKKKKSKIPSWQWMKLKKTIKYKPWSKTLKVEL